MYGKGCHFITDHRSSLQPRLAQSGKLALQYCWIFDRRSLLVNLQRELGIEPQDFRRFSSRLCFSTEFTVDRRQGKVGAQNVGVAAEILLQGVIASSVCPAKS